MLYTEDFTMRHYVGFSQIGSHIIYHLRHHLCSCVHKIPIGGVSQDKHSTQLHLMLH